jgi:hypothetical protein
MISVVAGDPGVNDDRQFYKPNYWSLDTTVGRPGRAQGADACLIGWPGTPTDPRITPMGWRSGYERGHLVASQLGGPETNTERKNFVPLTPSANSAMSHGVEKEVAERLRRKERIFYVVVPEYHNKGNHVPKQGDVWVVEQCRPRGRRTLLQRSLK